MDFYSLITEVAFPIATTFICMFYIREQNKDAREERKEIMEKVMERLETLSNLILMKKTVDSLQQLEEEIENDIRL